MLHKKHKDILIRVIAGLIGGAYIGYIARMLTTGKTDVSTASQTADYAKIAFCLIVAGIITINTFHPLLKNRIKTTLAITGLILICVGQYFLKDSPDAYIFLADLTKVFGMLVFVGGATGAIIPTDVIEEIQESKIEIIEA